MPSRHVTLRETEPAALREGLRRLRAELGIPVAFPADVMAAAREAAASPRLPDVDLTAVGFVTLDPAGSTDLDQAFHLSRQGGGYLIRYAIADIAAFITPGDALDREAHQRGLTYYAPSGKAPLHPEVLSQGAASLLPGQVRSALVWELATDAAGVMESVEVSRALVRSQRQWTYPEAQAALEGGTADEQLLLLRTIGRLRQAREAERGGVSLAVPEQEVHATEAGWELSYRRGLEVEEWNAQLSLATGMAAASLMLQAGRGVLRTLPPAKDSALDTLRRTASALEIAWPPGEAYPGFVRSLDPDLPRHAAMVNACTLLFRGAGYQVFTGAPEQPLHAAIAAPYTHVTAPLRRLVDRYTGEICLAICAGTPTPEWVQDRLAALPAEMEASARRAKKFERGIVDLVEAMVLAPQLGSPFTGTVIKADSQAGVGTLQLTDPAVQAEVRGAVSLGDEIQATLVAADLVRGRVQFETLPRVSAEEPLS